MTQERTYYVERTALVNINSYLRATCDDEAVLAALRGEDHSHEFIYEPDDNQTAGPDTLVSSGGGREIVALERARERNLDIHMCSDCGSGIKAGQRIGRATDRARARTHAVPTDCRRRSEPEQDACEALLKVWNAASPNPTSEEAERTTAAVIAAGLVRADSADDYSAEQLVNVAAMTCAPPKRAEEDIRSRVILAIAGRETARDIAIDARDQVAPDFAAMVNTLTARLRTVSAHSEALGQNAARKYIGEAYLDEFSIITGDQ